MNTVPFEELTVDLTKTVREMTMMASETKSGTGRAALSARGYMVVDEVDSGVEIFALFRKNVRVGEL